MTFQTWLFGALLALMSAACALCVIDAATVIPNRCDDMRPRLEIRDLALNADQFSVFILGLTRMKEANSSDPMSYYKIAGIHGFPYNGYDDVKPCAGCSTGDGFCPHTSHIFAIWHRPYLALFERSLRTNAMAVVAEFPDGPVKRRYLRAAQNLRLPYWDFAKPAAPGDNILPSMFIQPAVTVTAPYGRATIDNPLYQYDFNGNSAPTWSALNKQKTTRHPLNRNNNISEQDAAVAAVQALQDPQGHNLHCGLYRLMYQENNINNFGGSAWVQGATNTPYDNIESIHNDIHDAVGGHNGSSTNPGTMYYLASASFDPIFWMHHAMVDRMLAMWQTLHPNSWIETHNGTKTWTISADMNVNGSTPLTPFFTDTNGTSWTGDAARSIASFCYSYPDVDRYATVGQVSSAINSLYGQGCLVDPPPDGWPPLAAPHSQINNTNGTIAPRDSAYDNIRSLYTLIQTIGNLITDDGAMRDYVANIQMDSMALGESATVYIFDGSVSEDPGTWDSSPHLIGKRTFLVKSMNAISGQPQKGTIPLSNALIARVQDTGLSGMGNEEVLDYLKSNMNWKVVEACGKVVPNERVPGLVVSVVTADVQPASHQAELPVWGNPRLLSEITAGRPGGLKA